jgi:hypothetical protein
MTWKDLLKNQRVKPHQTSHEELHDLRAVVERDLKDAKIDQLSADRRFATAYNAVLQLTKTVLNLAFFNHGPRGAFAHK